MSVWAIAMVKDEADVIEATLRHVAAQGVEGIIVADNGSTDGTREIIERVMDEAPHDVEIVSFHDGEVAYYQSRKMTELANDAHDRGAEWVWPFDADELWYYGESERLADRVEMLGVHHPDVDVLQTRLWHHFPTALDDALLSGIAPFKAMHYRQAQAAPLGKVIVRWAPGAVIEAGNHSATIDGDPPSIMETGIQVRHFPYRSEEQFITKAINGSRAYAETDLPWSTGQHWREYGAHYEQGGEDALRRIYREHFLYDLPSAAGLVYDPARIDS